MLAGFGTSIVWVEFFKERTYDLYEAIPGFFAGLAVTLLVSKLSQKQPAEADSA
jgi:Na+/proline symporter